jgi:hypothetical protein
MATEFQWIDADEWLAQLARSGSIAIGGFACNRTRPLTFDEAAQLATSCRLPYEHHSDGSTLIRVAKRRVGRRRAIEEDNAR